MKPTIGISLKLTLYDRGLTKYTVSVDGVVPSLRAYRSFFSAALELLIRAGAPPIFKVLHLDTDDLGSND